MKHSRRQAGWLFFLPRGGAQISSQCCGALTALLALPLVPGCRQLPIAPAPGLPPADAMAANGAASGMIGFGYSIRVLGDHGVCAERSLGARGDVIGTRGIRPQHLFRFMNGHWTAVGELPIRGGASVVTGRGEVLGWALCPRGRHAAERSAFTLLDGRLRSFRPRAGLEFENAVGIDRNGSILSSGHSTREGRFHPSRAYLVSSLGAKAVITDDQLRRLGIPPGSTDVIPIGVNSAGSMLIAVRNSVLMDDIFETGIVVTGGRVQAMSDDSDSLQAGRLRSCTPAAITGSGEVVGETRVRGTKRCAFSWKAGRFKLLPSFGDGEASATAANDHGEVVGWAMCGGRQVAVLWRGQQAWDLSGLIHSTEKWHPVRAEGINNAGEILVLAEAGHDQTRMLLTPVRRPAIYRRPDAPIL